MTLYLAEYQTYSKTLKLLDKLFSKLTNYKDFIDVKNRSQVQVSHEPIYAYSVL